MKTNTFKLKMPKRSYKAMLRYHQEVWSLTEPECITAKASSIVTEKSLHARSMHAFLFSSPLRELKMNVV